MKKKLLLLVIIIVVIFIVTRPTPKPTEAISEKFGNEQAVILRGYSADAMEPSISRDGQYLFWNSLNDGVDTKLHYATRIDSATFDYIGEVSGVNGEKPHLDAVASMDMNNNFYFVSTRNYPNVFENYQSGKFQNGTVTNVRPVTGDFYKRELGWLVMDAEISPDGSKLYYANARFNGGALPVESDIGVAQKNGDGFIKDPESDNVFKNINTKKYIEYAPTISVDGKELLFTRLVGKNTYIYVASRNSVNEPFSIPQLLNIKGDVPEGASLTADGKTVYYHKKDGGLYKIFKMDRIK